MNFAQDLQILAKILIKLSLKNNIFIASCESCTGGLLSSLLTSVSGSSKVFDCGFITYSNESKINLLNIDSKIIQNHGAVSQEVADMMAKNPIKKSNANLSIAITGIAGPKSDNGSKEVGLVFISSFNKDSGNLISQKFNFQGSRDKVRNLAILKSMEILINQVKNHEIN